MTATPSRPTRPTPTRPRRAPTHRPGRTITPHTSEPEPTSAHATRAVHTGRHLHAPHLRGQLLVALLAVIYTISTRTGLRYLFDHIKSGVIVTLYTTLLFKLFSAGAPIPNLLLFLALYTATFIYFRHEQNSLTDEYAAQHIRARHDLLGDA